MTTENIINSILSLLNGTMLSFMAYKFLHTYQLNNYRIGKFLNWCKNTNGKYISRLAMITFFSLGGLIVSNVLFRAYEQGLFTYVGLVFYFVIGGIFVYYEARLPKKKPLVFTKRMTRLYATLFVVTTVATYYLFVASTLALDFVGGWLNLRHVGIALTPVFLPLFVLVATLINKPFESVNNARYVKKAEKILSERNDLIKIGITGSYAKTSVKCILEKMLSQKYETLATPASFNTPLGIAKCVSKLKPEHKVFIAEMGARNQGDIKTLCSIVHPTCAVITGIASQHLESFKTIESIVKTKAELVESLPSDGLAVVNGDSPRACEIFENCATEKILTTAERTEKSFAYAKDIDCGRNGSRFVLVIDGKELNCVTRLLGKHHVSNIVLCAALAYKLGVDLHDIALSIAELQPIKHRLELVPTKNGIAVVDDTFNANEEGTKAALDALSMFSGRKVIVTPGLVELGTAEKEKNREFGERIAKVCDVVILIGEIRSEPIKEGVLSQGFPQENLIVMNSLAEVKANFPTILKQGDVVLLENDLPDDYSEVKVTKKKK